MSMWSETDLFPICSVETNPTPRKGAQPGDTCALSLSPRALPRRTKGLKTWLGPCPGWYCLDSGFCQASFEIPHPTQAGSE